MYLFSLIGLDSKLYYYLIFNECFYVSELGFAFYASYPYVKLFKDCH